MKGVTVANLEKILKEEMRRLAKREVNQFMKPLYQQLVELRKTVRQQRHRIEQLEKALSGKADQEALVIAPESVSEDDDVRVPKGSVRKHRERLELTQREVGLLLDVTSLTVSNWETERASPRGKNKLAFAELRKMGKREVMERLEKLES